MLIRALYKDVYILHHKIINRTNVLKKVPTNHLVFKEEVMEEIQTKIYKLGMPTDGTHHLILICINCKEEFVWDSSAQKYFQEKGYRDAPKRCKSCHTKYKKEQRAAIQTGRVDRFHPNHPH